MAKRLTAPSVERLKVGEARREIPDGGCAGLYLVIQPSGVKSWAMRYRRPGGRTAKLTLGRVDLDEKDKKEAEADPVLGQKLLTLRSARRLVADLHRQLAAGKDIAAAKRREKLERETRGARTFGRAAIDFVEQHAMRETRRWKETARLLGVRPVAEGGELELIPKGLADRWRDRPLADIDGDEVHLVVDEVREHGVPGLERRVEGPSEPRARAMFRALSTTFSWLVAKRRLGQNPCAGVARPKTSEKRDRVLTTAEVAAFWRACAGLNPPFTQLLRLLLLTGCRLGEVAGMRREEVSGGTWTIPGERVKNGLDHDVFLPELARDVLASVASPSDTLVFTTTGTSPPSGWSKIKRSLDTAMQIPSWRLHDLRRTCATSMADIGVAPHIVEACLNHVSGARAGVAGVYNRASYAEEKRDAWETWARFVSLVVDDGLRTAQREYLEAGDDGRRKEARKAFAAAVHEGGDRWARYLETILAGDRANVVSLPKRTK